MYARTTDIEIDMTRISVSAALARFEQDVLPALRVQPGYRGLLVLTTPEGKVELVSLWDAEEQAQTATPFYESTLADHVTLFRSPPGRGTYSVAFCDGALATA
jgi:hypothetical protein